MTNKILLVCATCPIVGLLTGRVIPAGKVGKVLSISLEGQLIVDFGLPTVHHFSLTDNRIAILATKEVTE